MLAQVLLSLTVAWASLSAALAVEDFFDTHQLSERYAGYYTFDLSQFEPIEPASNLYAPAFCESEWSGNYKPIHQVSLWWSTRRLEGIQALYSDGIRSPLYGSTKAPSSGVIAVDYGAGHRRKQWTTWYNENGDGRVSSFVIAATNRQQSHAGYPSSQAISMGFFWA